MIRSGGVDRWGGTIYILKFPWVFILWLCTRWLQVVVPRPELLQGNTIATVLHSCQQVTMCAHAANCQWGTWKVSIILVYTV